MRQRVKYRATGPYKRLEDSTAKRHSLKRAEMPGQHKQDRHGVFQLRMICTGFLMCPFRLPQMPPIAYQQHNGDKYHGNKQNTHTTPIKRPWGYRLGNGHCGPL